MDKSLLPNIYEFVSKTYPFTLLSEFERDIMATKIKINYYKKDEVLENDSITGVGLFMIRTGLVETRNTEDNSLHGRFSMGDIFGFSLMEKEGKSHYKVIFLENTLLYLLPKSVLNYLIAKNSTIGTYLNSKEWVRLSSSHHYADEHNNEQTGKTVAMIASHDLSLVSPDDDIKKTALSMEQHNSDISLVMEDNNLVGIVTKSDITLKAVARGLELNKPISTIMTRSVKTINSHQSLFDAIEMMIMYDVKNLPVLDEGKVFGTVSTTSLMRNSKLQCIYLSHEILQCHEITRLIELSSQKQEIFETLVKTNVKPHTIQKIMSHIADNFAQVLLQMGEQKFGTPPCKYAFVAAGSQARTEVQFLSDQDNCIITATQIDDTQRQYFEQLASFVNDNLDKCGYPLCDGNYMAKNPRWLQSLETFKKYYDEWILNNSEDALLSGSVFLDMRTLYGDTNLVKDLREHLIKRARSNTRFMATLMKISAAVAPPVGTFRQFVLTKDGDNKPYLNIKKQAINLIIEMARLYAIAAGSTSVDTYERLQSAYKANLIKEENYKELTEAYTFLNYVRFNHQLQALHNHEELSNHIVPKELSQFERNHLRDAFVIIAKHQKGALMHFSHSLGV